MERRNYHGLINDKERTKLKLVEAVGIIIKTDGYTELKVNKIARLAGVDKKLIYTYFKSVNNLIEVYIKGKDYWHTLNEDPNTVDQIRTKTQAQEFANSILIGQLNNILHNIEMQEVLLWGLAGKHEILREICTSREIIGEQLFEEADLFSPESEIDLRAICAIQSAGIYYLVLYAKANNSLFCGIDLNTIEGKQRIENAIRWILSKVYN